MTFDVEVGGRTIRVVLTRGDQGWQAIVDGRARHVDAAQAGTWTSLLIGQPASSYEIAIEDRGRGELIAHVDGIAVPVTMIDPRAVWSRRGHDHGSAGGGPRQVVAPMPGRVVKVLVNRGDVVAERQGLVVVEAMKMENELRSPKDGTIVDVRVSEGISVEAGAVLVVVD